MTFDLRTPEGMANAKAWAVNLLAGIKQGGVWIVPRSLSVYEIDHEHKVATKRWGFPDPAITKVFEEIGWRVVDHSESPPYAGLRKEQQ